MRAPGRRFSCTTWPSTHSVDILSTYSPIFIESRRTGHGRSAVVSAAFSGSGPRPWGAGALMRRTLGGTGVRPLGVGDGVGATYDGGYG